MILCVEKDDDSCFSIVENVVMGMGSESIIQLTVLIFAIRLMMGKPLMTSPRNNEAKKRRDRIPKSIERMRIPPVGAADERILATATSDCLLAH